MIILTDPHGHFNTMMALLDQIPQKEKDKGIVICGDLVDRGPRSKQIIQWCIDNKIPVVRGNHEDMMLDEIQQALNYMAKNRSGCIPRNSLWTTQGGYETLQSYIIEIDGEQLFELDVLEEHLEWLRNLPYYLEFKDVKNDEDRHLLITHSSANRVWKHRNSKDPHRINNFNQDVTWNRDGRIKDIPGIFNVFGHTPQEDGPRIRKTYANIDTGCFYYGILTALQFPEMKVYTQENVDKDPPVSVFEEIED